MWVSTEIRLPRLTIAGRSLHEPLDNQIDLPLSPYIISNIPNVGKHEKRNLMKIKYITTQPRIIHLTKIKQMKNHNNAMKTKTLKKTPSVLAIITTIAACGGGPIQETNSTLQKQSETPISQTPSPPLSSHSHSNSNSNKKTRIPNKKQLQISTTPTKASLTQ